MSEDRHKTLVFVDILGFASVTLDSRRRLLRSRTGNIESAVTSDMARRANQFSSAIEGFLYKERLNGTVHGMVFSDCAFLELGSFHRAAFGAARLMQELLKERLPVRMGIGRGTFYAEQFATNLMGETLVTKSVFFGTAVVNAHQAEQCGAKGMRILVHSSAVPRRQAYRGSLQLVPLPKRFGAVRFELDYLDVATDWTTGSDEKLFQAVADIYPRAAPLKVRRQYIETFKALNRMRRAHNRREIPYRRLPGYKKPFDNPI